MSRSLASGLGIVNSVVVGADVPCTFAVQAYRRLASLRRVMRYVDELCHLAWRDMRGLRAWGARGDSVECFIAVAGSFNAGFRLAFGFADGHGSHRVSVSGLGLAD
jgi:hypothetical protein